MKDMSAHAFAYVLNSSLLTTEQQEEFEKFRSEYKNRNKRQITREIMKVKSKLSQDVINKHIKNLDALAKMEGFVTDEAKANIEYIKKVLSQEARPGRGRPNPNASAAPPPQQQFVGGASLLLWFLILVAIW